MSELDFEYSQVADHITVAQELQDQQARAANIAALGGRVGRSIHRLRSTGLGNAKGLVRINFALTFAERPVLVTGVELAGGRLDLTALPLTTVGVHSWIRDGRKLYTGCHVFVAVGLANDSSAPSTAAPRYVLDHHLIFEGAAIRDVQYDAIMAG